MSNPNKRSHTDGSCHNVTSKRPCNNNTRPVDVIDIESESQSHSNNILIDSTITTTDTSSSSQPHINNTTINSQYNNDHSSSSQESLTSLVSVNPIESINIGDIVEVDGKDKAEVISISTNASSGKYTVRYLVGRSVEYALSKDRIKVCTLRTGTTTRSGLNRHAQQNPIESGTDTEESELSKEFKTALNASFCTKKYDSNNPLYKFLLHNNQKSKGWIREIIQNKRVDQQTVLIPKEKQVLMLIKALFSGYAPQGNDNPVKGYQSLICKAFGTCNNTVNNVLAYFTNRSFTMERKTHKSKNKSVFNDEDIRIKTYTGYNMYKRRKTTEFRDSTERLSEEEYRSGYDNLSQSEKDDFDVLAEQYLDRSRFLWEDLKKILLRTKGKVSYKELENQLGGIINHQSIANFLHTQKGFRLRKDRILPHLNAAAKLRRVNWAKLWWTFWKGVASIPTKDAVVVNVHMDEKWFYAVRTRSNCKELTSIGLEGNNYHLQHKSHVGKEMYIVVTAFVPNENDMTKGGKAIPISCIRCGELKTIEKTTYKRVYRDNGTYHYPHIPGNESKWEGTPHFKNYDLTGDSEGTTKDPKCSLLKIYREQIIPALEEKIVKKFSNNATRKVIIVKQEDSAGCHQNQNYLNQMRSMFEERGWILFNQPSQSPITNVHDACIFPMMSKSLSKIQAVDYYARVLQGEQLHYAVMKVWNHGGHEVAMSRAFAGHFQVVCAILENNGDNNFLSDKQGLSFGIRKMFVADQDGKGVIPVPLAPECVGETAQGILLSVRGTKGLKYVPPDISKFENITLKDSMIRLLDKYADESKMSEDVKLVVKPQLPKFQINRIAQTQCHVS